MLKNNLFLLTIFETLLLLNGLVPTINNTLEPISLAMSKIFTSVCGEVFDKKQFVLESVNYPSNYPANSDCSYLFKGPFCATQYNLQFLDFDVEASQGCTKDRLEIENRDALCGNKNGIKTYFAQNGALEVRFISDGDGFGRGYRILVTRLPCGTRNENEAPTTETPGNTEGIYTEMPHNPYTTEMNNAIPSTNNLLPNKQRCCSASYNSKRFILTSPNFPNSMSYNADCIYPIYKANPNVCRLRIHALFFWMGNSDRGNCAEGYLQIDGKFICACKTDLKLVSTFQDAWDTAPKIIRFRSEGIVRNSYSGFILEIIQDDCPERISPAYDAKNETQFSFHNDQIHRVPWMVDDNETLVDKIRLVSQNTEIVDENTSAHNTQSRVIKDFYFFTFPEDNQQSDVSRDVEEITYVDTSSINNVLWDKNHNNACRGWNQLQFDKLYANGKITLEQCNVNKISIPKPKCMELGYVLGYFQSPGYPFYYPGDLNMCYRFIKQQGYCGVKIYMPDFHIENSPNCMNDYLLFDNQYKYCGHRLFNTVSYMDLTNKFHEDINFVTNKLHCGRGFSGLYEQIPCRDHSYPAHPTLRSPLPILPTIKPITNCDRFIREETFIIEVSGHHSNCEFIIHKLNENVCSIVLYFEHFELSCLSEMLVINGEEFCGENKRKVVTIDVQDKPIEIRYNKISNVESHGVRLRIRGTQLIQQCLEVPAQRIFHGNVRGEQQTLVMATTNFKEGAVERTTQQHGGDILAKRRYFSDDDSDGTTILISTTSPPGGAENRTGTAEVFQTTMLMGINDTEVDNVIGVSNEFSMEAEDIKYIIALEVNSTEVCGMITNATMTSDFCDILFKRTIVTKCITTVNDTLVIPVNSTTMNLRIENITDVEEVVFNVIDCDKLNSEHDGERTTEIP